MSSGKWVYDGAVATSDRTIPKGTKVLYEGREYVVEDRTNIRFQNFSVPTIDIWMENRDECIKFGVKYDKVIIK